MCPGERQYTICGKPLAVFAVISRRCWRHEWALPNEPLASRTNVGLRPTAASLGRCELACGETVERTTRKGQVVPPEGMTCPFRQGLDYGRRTRLIPMPLVDGAFVVADVPGSVPADNRSPESLAKVENRVVEAPTTDPRSN